MFLEEIINFNDKNNYGITGLTNQLIVFYVDKLYKIRKKNIILVTNSLYEANRIYDSLIKLNENTLLFPMDDFLTSEAVAISPELKSIRIDTLNNLAKNSNKIVVTNLMGLLRYLPSKDLWKDNIIKLEKGENISKDKLLEKLIQNGYENNSIITRTGEIANRGFILDVFPINYENPIRIEFWGDEIDSIRFFDIDTQRSLENICSVIITPFSEFINEKNIDIESKQKYLPNVVQNVSNIFEYLENPITIFKDYNQIKNSYSNLVKEIFEFSKTDKTIFKTDYMNKFENYNFNQIIYLLILENKISNINKIYNVEGKIINEFESNINLINDYIKNKLNRNKTVIISLNDENKLKNLKKFLEVDYSSFNKKIEKNKLNIIISDIDEGFELKEYVLITEKELYGKVKKSSKIKPNFKIGTKIKEINNLNIGDYVVHYNHGIGVYNGIKTLTKKGNKKDYLEINYLGNDRLYIPVEKIELIHKYSAKEGLTPKINKLSGTEWQKTKLRVKNRIQNIASKLLKISAERASKKGISFNKDDELQISFESEFKYELTKDQKISLEKIKVAMEKNTPMDMLLCGDVGYGKTEVAFRAIFKAVNSNKQVAYLCPTTILSKQQYSNALDRFKNFGVNIALINRFTSLKESKEIISNLNEGKIDIIFGTHRLLSNDIKFKDLGLLVIDEEQRFGVTHKEKIKQYKSLIDVLTLSATPIPRTLQMSLVGIRDLALIETPPAARCPVQTYVIEESDQLVREAIYKEMSRKGQVYILFNNVEKIENQMIKIQSLVPEAKIKFAHGKMSKVQIEETMNSFINNEFDVLLCTTIIETGIDISNVNTLIIYNADKFGLSQLYQIRGRVGRSNKIAYAYLMYEKNKVLNEVAVKRLNSIKEFTELGSGFSIAMRDLSIRGAGDILGSEQAGFIDDIGYDLYVKLLNDEVEKLKGNEIKENVIENEKPIIDVTTHIDDNYISNDILKVEIHKMINNINSLEEIEMVKKELVDRFGKIDENLMVYMYSEWLEKLAKKLNITKIDQDELSVTVYLEKELFEKIDVSKLFEEANKISNKFNFNYKYERLNIKLPISSLEKHFVYYLTDLLAKIQELLV